MKKNNKYRNTKISNVYGQFDSIKEWKRYIYLLDLQKKGIITELRRQVPFVLIPSQKEGKKVIERACTYIADFVYKKGSETIVEDTKSAITKANVTYIIKRKMMLFFHKIKIKEV